MTTVRTGSRLHFGLFDVCRFGGIGMMIDEPAVIVTASRHNEWSIPQPFDARLQLVRAKLAQANYCIRPVTLNVTAPAEHVGFGSGTQVTLAIAQAILAENGLAAPVVTLAKIFGRGQRSAIGIYGFMLGGLLLDRGIDETGGISPLVDRLALPSSWQVLLVSSPQNQAWSGQKERNAFALLQSNHTIQTQARLRTLANQLVAAAADCDIITFGSALTMFNKQAGQLFAPVQGGPYSSPDVAETIERFLKAGAKGVGQSSWGPTVFAFDDDVQRLTQLGREIASSDATALITRPRNTGANTGNHPT